MFKLRSVLAALTLGALLALGVGGPAMAASHSVSAVDFNFSPGSITISVGDSITWANNGASPHTATADDGSFDSGNLDPGQSYTHTFASAGTFAYHCQYHAAQGMVGTVVVAAGATGSGGSTSGGGLPNTGASPLTGPMVVLGLLFLVAGGAVLFRLRRRGTTGS